MSLLIPRHAKLPWHCSKNNWHSLASLLTWLLTCWQRQRIYLSGYGGYLQTNNIITSYFKLSSATIILCKPTWKDRQFMGAKGKTSTVHQRLSPVFAGNFHTVVWRFGKPSDPTVTRSRAQQLPVISADDISTVPTLSAPVMIAPVAPSPQISIFEKPFASMTESEPATTFLNHDVVFVLPLAYKPPAALLRLTWSLSVLVSNDCLNWSLLCGLRIGYTASFGFHSSASPTKRF